jgi:hypothetical protein
MYSKYIMFSYPQAEPIKHAYKNNCILDKSKLGYATNNVHPNMPANMTDGRSLVAAHQPEAVLNETILQNSGVKSNWEYRKYLTENSQQIGRDNFQEACNDVGYFERFTPQERTDLDQQYTPPSSHLLYKDRGTILNEKSDLKDLYLSRDELQSKFQPVTLTQDELFHKISK